MIYQPRVCKSLPFKMWFEDQYLQHYGELVRPAGSPNSPRYVQSQPTLHAHASLSSTTLPLVSNKALHSLPLIELSPYICDLYQLRNERSLSQFPSIIQKTAASAKQNEQEIELPCKFRIFFTRTGNINYIS